MKICLKDRAVNIHKLFLLHWWKFCWIIFQQICEIIAIMDEKRVNIDKKFPQSSKISSDRVCTSGSFLMSATLRPKTKTFILNLKLTYLFLNGRWWGDSFFGILYFNFDSVVVGIRYVCFCCPIVPVILLLLWVKRLFPTRCSYATLRGIIQLARWMLM